MRNYVAISRADSEIKKFKSDNIRNARGWVINHLDMSNAWDLYCFENYESDLLSALIELSGSVKGLREGKRDGGTMGCISIADDEARDAIAKAGVK